MINETEVLTVNPIRITVGSVRDAISAQFPAKRDMARSYILNKIIEGLDDESSEKLTQFSLQEDPCRC